MLHKRTRPKLSSDLKADDVAAVRVHVSAAAKRAVAVKEDDLLTKHDIMNQPKEVSGAQLADVKI